MKNSLTCPKCQSNEILRIPGKQQMSAYDVAQSIRVGGIIKSVASVERFVCGNCGFIEDWVESPEALEKIRSKYGA